MNSLWMDFALPLGMRSGWLDLNALDEAGERIGYARYQAWLAAGHAGQMNYLASERHLQLRRQPTRLFPGARSLLVFALPYSPPAPPPTEIAQPACGQIAGYALAPDYHRTLPALIESAMDRLSERLNRPIRRMVCTDSAPLLERGIAAAAGLGWIGRSGNLIIPGVGSCFLLGEALCDLPFPLDAEPAAPLPDRCGTCRRCIESCPTGCILPDRTIDAGRCISFQTIEQKGSIPPELRPLVGQHVFGCDVCQQVCPWNRKTPAPPPDAERLDPSPPLSDLLRLSSEEFRRRYGRTPVQRAKRDGLVRNACIAAGNSDDLELVPDLIRLLAEEEAETVRAAAAWGLEQLGGWEAVRALREHLEREKDPGVRAEVRDALFHLRG